MNFQLPIFEYLQDPWEPLTPKDVNALEERLSAQLPDDYRTFLLQYNGGEWRHSVAFSFTHPRLQSVEIYLARCFGVVGDPRFACDDIEQVRLTFAELLPRSLIPILDAWGTFICLDVRDGSAGRICYLDLGHRSTNVEPGYALADSFGEFVQGLVATRPNSSFRQQAPVFRAIEQGDLPLLRELLADENNVEARNEQGWTLLMCACRCRWPKIVKMLLESGADPNLRDLHGWTPLHHAAASSSLDSAKRLIASGADSKARDSIGNCAAAVARSENHYRIAYFLEGL